MLRSQSPLIQAVLGGCFTWLLTAIGAAAVFANRRPDNVLVMDISLGFAAGVMTAASFWSLLKPALAQAHQTYGVLACLPVAGGFILGGLFVLGADWTLKRLGMHHEPFDDLVEKRKAQAEAAKSVVANPDADQADMQILQPSNGHAVSTTLVTNKDDVCKVVITDSTTEEHNRLKNWKRIMLLIVAIVVHNVPEGAAVGIAFASATQEDGPSFGNAVTLTVGMGIQNLPEGMAVSLPLLSVGYSRWRSFFYGQLSGMVEPVASFLGALLVTILSPIQPYALSFAAGAMIYVVVEDIIPAGHEHSHGKYCSAAAMVGFAVMMTLDVTLG